MRFVVLGVEVMLGVVCVCVECACVECAFVECVCVESVLVRGVLVERRKNMLTELGMVDVVEGRCRRGETSVI